MWFLDDGFLVLVFGVYAVDSVIIVDGVLMICCKLHAHFPEKISSYSYSYSYSYSFSNQATNGGKSSAN